MSNARVNHWWVSGFTADTPVLMADGKSKPISKIQEGDIVLSFDPETGVAEPKLVTDTWSETMSDIIELDLGDKQMIVASEQHFYTPEGEFKSAYDASGILAIDGSIKTFTSRKAPGKIKLYDITVEDNHAFFADGLMVHNKGKKRPPPPPPPPDPIVTVGRVNRPLTVIVNGQSVTVPPAPGSAARVNVSYRGAVSTGYHSVPGVAPLWPVPPLPLPRTPTAWVPRQKVAETETVRKQVCTEMIGYTGAVGNKRGSWVSSIEEMRRLLADAKRESPFIYAPAGFNLPPNAISPAVMVDMYQTTQNQIDDLRRYVKRNVNFTKKDSEFISGLCASIESGLKSITTQLDGYITRQPPALGRRPGWIYADSPLFNYYRFVQNYNGRELYYYSPPNMAETLVCYNGPDAVGCRPLSAYYYKNFDSQLGLTYYYRVSSPTLIED